VDVLAELYRAHRERGKEERAKRVQTNREWNDMTAEAGHMALPGPEYFLLGYHEDL